MGLKAVPPYYSISPLFLSLHSHRQCCYFLMSAWLVSYQLQELYPGSNATNLVVCVPQIVWIPPLPLWSLLRICSSIRSSCCVCCASLQFWGCVHLPKSSFLLCEMMLNLWFTERHWSFICELSSYWGGWANEVCFDEYFCYFTPIRKWQISSVAIDYLGKVLGAEGHAEQVAVLPHQEQGDGPSLCCPCSQCFN